MLLRLGNLGICHKVSREQWGAQWSDPGKVRSIPFGQVRKVESGPDGTLKVFMKDDAFRTATKGEEVDLSKSGVFAGDKYIMVKGQNGKYKKVTSTDIQAKGYFEVKDERFNKMNFANQLGLSVSAKPQQRWDASADGVSVPFEIRKNSVSGKVEVSVAGKPFQQFGSSDVSAVIAQVRKNISSYKYDEIINQQ